MALSKKLAKVLKKLGPICYLCHGSNYYHYTIKYDETLESAMGISCGPRDHKYSTESREDHNPLLCPGYGNDCPFTVLKNISNNQCINLLTNPKINPQSYRARRTSSGTRWRCCGSAYIKKK